MPFQSRRTFIRQAAGMAGFVALTGGCRRPIRRPNILVAISDDQSWLHTGAFGCRAVQTPAFDRIAAEGALCTQTYAVAPQCSPNRASLLTGRYIWQNREAGTHASSFPLELQVYPDLLETAGYKVGYTGKGWGPGDWKVSGRKRNPCGQEYNKVTRPSTPTTGMAKTDYVANLEMFLADRDHAKPFCFWFGCQEPHRAYEQGSGLRAGKALADVAVPSFLPDCDTVRSDLLDYLLEIEWFDQQLAGMIAVLEQSNELDNTLILVTSDNGMAFPHAKANLYEYGVHLPMAIRYPSAIAAGTRMDELISFVDLAPTLLDAAGVSAPAAMTGRSVWPWLTGDNKIPFREHVLFGRERHTHARPDNVGYPSRAIRSGPYLYIWNLKSERWPAGDPEGFYDIDGSPSKEYLLQHRQDEANAVLFNAACGLRPSEELYDVQKDPACLTNLAGLSDYETIGRQLRVRLEAELRSQGDPRMDADEIFDSYPRYSPMRDDWDGFKEQGRYNPAFVKKLSV